jgi:alpha-beta hydrolase superfamily lysophospholipase
VLQPRAVVDGPDAADVRRQRPLRRAGRLGRIRGGGAEAVVSVRRFQPLFHEIFNEPEQVEVFTALRDWLAAQARHL